MYQDFTFDNLRQVKLLAFDKNHGTIMMSKSKGLGSEIINMSFHGQDDKAIGFDAIGFRFIVRLMEQITGKKFKLVRRYRSDYLYYVADE